MYELYNGSERLLYALKRRLDDPVFINNLASVLYYQPEQLVQDIQALLDRVRQNENS